MSESADPKAKKSVGISELPIDELIHYGRELGLRLDRKMGQGELLRRVRDRQELLVELDREAMLDIAVWARHPVRASASKEELAKLIASITKMDMNGLSDRGLVALARLRGVPAHEEEARELIEARVRDAEPFLDRVRRRRRQLVGSLISKVVNGPVQDDDETYRFLPEEGHTPALQRHITEEGVVGGIARTIRGVADGYVHEKMDEIESRIDRKLDEIDRRLGEWRDREIANRLKIIKITLVASVLVALLSLGYNYLKWKSTSEGDPPAPAEVSHHAARMSPCEVGRPWL